MENLGFLAKWTYQTFVAPAGPFFKSDQYPDLKNKKWLVTGVTGGIGLEISRVLASLGAEMWIVGRNAEKLAKVQQESKELSKGAPIHVLVIDYNDLTTVRPAVMKSKEETTVLDGIVHNAGVMNVPAGAKTKQGLEQTLGVNNVATQLLQNLLDPSIVDNPRGRLVWLSSLAHTLAPRNGGFDLSIVANGSPERIYAMSKALVYIQAVQWSLRHPHSQVKSIAVHPGVIKSDLTRTTPKYQKSFFDCFGDTPEIGALPPLYAALYPDIKNNEYVVPYGRPGLVRPDIYRGARGDVGEAAVAWLDEKASGF